MSLAPLLLVQSPCVVKALLQHTAPRQIRARRRAACRATQLQSGRQAVSVLLDAIEGTDRGVSTTAEQRERILRAVAALEELAAGADTARDSAARGGDPCSPAAANGSVSATWKLLWTTEKVWRASLLRVPDQVLVFAIIIHLQSDKSYDTEVPHYRPCSSDRTGWMRSGIICYPKAPPIHALIHNAYVAAQELLFILKRASWFGTTAGDVFQIIDLPAGLLQNVITFPPDGAFVVDSTAADSGNARVSFNFTGASLRGRGWKYGLPPRGTGWWATAVP